MSMHLPGLRSQASEASHPEHGARLRPWLDDLLRDVRLGMRSLWHHRAASVFVILTLALGIGVNATMFGVVDTLMFEPPLDVVHPQQVLRVELGWPKQSGGGVGYSPAVNYATYKAWSRNVHGFQDVAAYWPLTTSIGRGPDARSLAAVLVTASFFRTLGTHPALGRFFRPDEERAEGTKTVVLGYGLWQSRFDGDRSVLGRTVYVAAQPCTVIGVAPPHFTGVDLKHVDAWLPIGMARTLMFPNALSDAPSLWLRTFVRLRPGVVPQVAAQQATAAFQAQWAKKVPPWSGVRIALAPLPLGRGPDVPADARVSLWLGLVSVLVLLVACANVANLLLARAAARSHEVAVRLSLGAGRWRISRQLLVESVMLALCGAVAAVLLMAWISSFAHHLLMPDVARVSAAVSFRVLLFAGGAALGTGILCGLAPALLGARWDLDAVLKGRSRGPAGRLRTQRVLVVGQVAFTLVLLAGAGLFVRSLRNVRDKDLGMDVSHVLYASVNFPSAGVSPTGAMARYEDMLRRVRALPGVAAAALSIGTPFGMGWGVGIEPTTGPASARTIPKGSPSPMGRAVGAGFFQATGRRFVAGRPFSADEHTPSARVAIINEAAARYYWRQKSPVGACIRSPTGDDGCFRIIGVVANTPMFGVTGPPGQELYVPLEVMQADPYVGRDLTMEVRTAGDPDAMVGRVRRAMMTAGPDIPFPSVRALTTILDPQYRSWELGADAFSAFGLLALLLAAVGLYGVLVYTVERRSRELGIRAALGADPHALVRMVVTSGLLTTLLGALIGLAAALLAGRFVASLLYDVSAHDPLSLAAAAAVLLLVAGAASYLPARKAARVDPLSILKAE